MNKRIISALVLTGMIATTSAFATNAREEVLGTGGANSNKGSFFYESEGNMFYNPSYVNDFKNWAGFEKGAAGSAEFGMVTSMMNMNMGLFFNNFGGTQNITSGTNATVADLMVGGDMGVKWGLGLNYGQQDSATAHVTKNFLGARLGAQFSGFDPFLGFTLMGEDKTGGVKSNSYKGMNAGFRYHYGEWIPYAEYKSTTSKTEPAAVETKTTTFVVGLGREAKLAEAARLVYAVFYKHQGRKIADVRDASGSVTQLPINLGVEADATSWLTLRAGATQTLIGTGVSKATTGRIGGTFHMSKVDVDYAFGNSSATGGTTSVTSDSADVGFDSGTFHKVAMRYSW